MACHSSPGPEDGHRAVDLRGGCLRQKGLPRWQQQCSEHNCGREQTLLRRDRQSGAAAALSRAPQRPLPMHLMLGVRRGAAARHRCRCRGCSAVTWCWAAAVAVFELQRCAAVRRCDRCRAAAAASAAATVAAAVVPAATAALLHHPPGAPASPRQAEASAPGLKLLTGGSEPAQAREDVDVKLTTCPQVARHLTPQKWCRRRALHPMLPGPRHRL